MYWAKFLGDVLRLKSMRCSVVQYRSEKSYFLPSMSFSEIYVRINKGR